MNWTPAKQHLAQMAYYRESAASMKVKPRMNTPTEQIPDLFIIAAMRKYGGSFVSALGDAALRADDSNLAKLKEAFPELWFKYSVPAKQMMQEVKS